MTTRAKVFTLVLAVLYCGAHAAPFVAELVGAYWPCHCASHEASP